MSSRDDLLKAAKERTELINEYIHDHDCDTRMVHNVFQSNKIEPIKVYELPRRLVRLNPNNGRFKAELDIIQRDRKQENKSIELDPDDPDDIEILQNMIKGKYPPSSERHRAYKNLYSNIHEVAQKTGTNGQEVPGLITYDGILINGNRRWVVMDELAAGDRKKHPAEPLKYDTIRVARLNPGADKFTLWKNEAKEQISQDSREEYDYVNSALEIKHGFELLKEQGMSEKKAKTEITKTVYGRTEKDITAYLDFLVIADLFLECVDKEGQYTFVQESGDDKGIVTILQEIAKEHKKNQKSGMGIDELDQWLQSAFVFCLFSREKPEVQIQEGVTKILSFGHREYRQFQKKVLDPPNIREQFLKTIADKKIEPSNITPESAKLFYQAVRESQEEYDINEDINTPVSLLKKAMVALSKVSQDLNGTRKGAMVQQIKNDGGLDHLSSINTYLKDIRQKIQ